MREYDLGFIVPLREEFRVLEKLFPVISSEVHDAIHYYTLKLPDSDYRAVAVVLGDMGKTLASHVTAKVLTHVKLKVIVLLGLAGALDKDLRLGDIVVADDINEFQVGSKAIQKGRLQYSSKHWQIGFTLKQCVGSFEFADKDLYNAWRNQVKDFLNSLGLSPEQLALANDFPEIKIGHIASGDIVGASEDYAVELLRIDRKLLAIEMEAAGVAQAAHGRREPIPIMVVRGISDFADERKKELDSVGDGVWRKYAMYSASAFVLNLLKTKSFQREIISQGTPSEQVALSAHLDALTRRPEYARWADRPRVREGGEDHYVQTESKILPLDASPYDDDTGQRHENLLKIIRAHDRLLVLGEPGVGKTAALERMMWEIADAKESVVPIYVPLLRYDGNLLAEVQDALGETGVLDFSSARDVSAFLRQHRCLILFDGLNEVRRNQRERVVLDIARFIRDYWRHRYVVTSRSQGQRWKTLRDEGVIQNAVVVQRITDDQVLEYLIAHLGDQEGTRTRDGLNKRLRDMARTPLFLWMLKEVRLKKKKKEKRGLPRNRGELFDQYIEKVFTRDKDKLQIAVPAPDKKKALANLAFTLQQARRLTCQKEEAINIVSKTRDGYDPQNLIREALIHGLLKGKQQNLRFMHQAVQEYFVALALREIVVTEVDNPAWQQLGKLVLRRGLAAWARDDWWAESFVQLAGLTDHPSWLAQMIAKVKPWLAFWCMIEGRGVDEQTRRDIEAHTVGFLRSDDVRKRQHAVRELGKLQNPRTAEYLADALGDEAEKVVNAAVQELGKLGEPAVKHLLPRLESDDIGVRWAATRALGLIWQFPQLVDLGKTDENLRLAALEALGRLGDTRVVRAIVTAARWDTDVAVRQRAIKTLGQLGDTWAIDPLLAVLDDNAPPLRASAATALGQIENERAVESLTEALKDDDEVVRRKAISALGRIWKLPQLVRLGDDSEAVRGRAALALGRLGDMRVVQPLVAALRDQDGAACASAAMALGQLGSAQTVEPLISVLLTRKEPAARMNAAKAMGELGNKRAIKPLIVTLKDPERNVRWSAVKALGRLRAEQAIEPLIAMFEDRDVQESAVTALAQIGRPAVLSLIAAFTERKREVRIGAARALGQIGGTHALEALLISLREDKDRIVRARVAVALGQIGGAQAIKALVAILREGGDKIVRASAAISLGQAGGAQAIEALVATLKNKDEDETVWRMAIRALGLIWNLLPVARLSDEEATVRRDAAVALGQLGDERAIEPLKATLRDRDEAVRRKAISALGRIWMLPQLVRLGDDGATERKDAAAALGQLGNVRAVEPLITALRDSSAIVRLAATQALGQLGNVRAVEPLIAVLDDSDRQVQQGAVEALQCLASSAIPRLITALQDSDYWFRRRRVAETLAQIGEPGSLIEALQQDDRHVRRSAAGALVQWGGIQAVEPLINVLRDDDYYVRRRAAEALGRIGDARAVKPLIEVLKWDDDWRARRAAAEAMGDIGHPSAVESLIAALGDDEWPVRWMAAKVLGKMRDSSAVRPLIEALEGDWPALWTVPEALGQLEDPRAVGSLVAALRSREGDRYVQQAAVEALGWIGEPIQKPLIAVLRKEDERMRQSAIAALGQMKDARNVEPLIEALKDTESYHVHQGAMEALVQLGEAAVEPLGAVLQEGDGRFEFRRRAARALGRIKDAHAVEPLIAALKGDKEAAVRRAAAEALHSIGTPEALAALRKYAREIRDPQ